MRDIPAERFPYLTADLPGSPAEVRASPEDYVVEEVPLYAPTGAGQHVLFEIEKRGRTTENAKHRLAEAWKLPATAISHAGLKDREAVTRQWLSVEGVDVETVRAYEGEDLRVLRAARHHNRLQMGHLKGNRFILTLRGVAPDALGRYQAIAERLPRDGVPNYFGIQRFGRKGDSAEVGAALIRGDADGAVRAIFAPPPKDVPEDPAMAEVRGLVADGRWDEAAGALPRGYREEGMLLRALGRNRGHAARAITALPYSTASLYVSAWQAEIFNRVVADRIGDLGTLHEGDVATFTDRSASFLVKDPTAEQPRADAFEISPSGPIAGPKLLRPTGDPGRREAAILAAAGVTDPNAIPKKVLRFVLKGERRALRIPLREFTMDAVGADAVRLEFFLPKGCYATAVLREFLKD